MTDDLLERAREIIDSGSITPNEMVDTIYHLLAEIERLREREQFTIAYKTKLTPMLEESDQDRIRKIKEAIFRTDRHGYLLTPEQQRTLMMLSEAITGLDLGRKK